MSFIMFAGALWDLKHYLWVRLSVGKKAIARVPWSGSDAMDTAPFRNAAEKNTTCEKMRWMNSEVLQTSAPVKFKGSGPLWQSFHHFFATSFVLDSLSECSGDTEHRNPLVYPWPPIHILRFYTSKQRSRFLSPLLEHPPRPTAHRKPLGRVARLSSGPSGAIGLTKNM